MAPYNIYDGIGELISYGLYKTALSALQVNKQFLGVVHGLISLAYPDHFFSLYWVGRKRSGTMTIDILFRLSPVSSEC